MAARKTAWAGEIYLTRWDYKGRSLGGWKANEVVRGRNQVGEFLKTLTNVRPAIEMRKG